MTKLQGYQFHRIAAPRHDPDHISSSKILQNLEKRQKHTDANARLHSSQLCLIHDEVGRGDRLARN